MLTISIQAGGKSSRMGQDKALMPFLGQPLIARLVARLRPLADELILTTNRPDDYRFLGLPLFPDLFAERGALGGLHTALACASLPYVAVVACDMPFASPALICHQRDLLLAADLDVVIPAGPEGGLEPLHALYRRDTCLPACEQALINNQWKLISWFPRVKVRTLAVEELLPYDPEGRVFWNLNTPNEFARAELAAAAE